MKQPFQLRTLIAGLAGFFTVACAMANPTGVVVASGRASLSPVSMPSTTINSPGAIINWQTFTNVPGVQYVQQSAASVVLNRVTGNSPTVLLGSLQSSGRVFIVNPAGGAFGAPSGVTVGNTIEAGKTIELSDPKNPGLSIQVTAPANRNVNVQQVVDAVGKRDIGSVLNFGNAPRSATAAVRDAAGNIVLRVAP
jgi:filamentous hemagglutinin family protein